MNFSTVIRPEQVAAKLAALKSLQSPNFEKAVAGCPRQIELIHSTQWHSLRPGGLRKFTSDFLDMFSDRIGTAEMHRIRKIESEYTAAERQQVISGFPRGFRLEHCVEHVYPGMFHPAQPILNEFLGEMLGTDGDRPNLAFTSRQNYSYFFGYCRQIAEIDLPLLLHHFCTTPDVCLPEPWYFKDLQGALINMLDAHAAASFQNLAKTQVSTEVIDGFNFAWSEKCMVEFIGDSRLGKTETSATCCVAYPGRYRLVKTPCDNWDRSLLEGIAEAAGIEVTLKMTYRELKNKVEFVLKHSGLLWAFDEAAWLIPQRYSATTTPMRLNYVRSQILENGCPVVLLTTPQFFQPAAKSFEKTTGFNMAQFKGRIMRTVELPKDLPEADLLAVVKIHFPDLKEVYARHIVAAALISESFLFAVEKIAKNARAVAQKNGRTQIEKDDLDQGIRLAGIVLPTIAPSTAPKPSELPAPARRRAIKPATDSQSVTTVTSVTPESIDRPTSHVAMTAPARQVTPLQIQPI